MIKRPIRVLLIDDDEDDYVILRDMLNDITQTDYSLDWVSTFGEGKTALEQSTHDLYLLDYYFEGGDRTGLNLLELTQKLAVYLPIVVITGRGSYDVDWSAMKHGASAYLEKYKFSADSLDRTFRYVLERTQHFSALQENANHLQNIFDNTSDLIYSTTTNGQFIIVNRVWLQILQYQEDNVLHLTLQDIVHPDYYESYLNIHQQLQYTGSNESFYIETVFVAQDGTAIELQGTLSCHLTPENKLIVHAILQNLDEQNRLKEKTHQLALEQAKLQLITQFISDVSHEFRTPLTIINTHLYLLNKSANLNQQDRIAHIQNETNAITSLVQELTTLIRIDSGNYLQIMPCNIRHIVQDCLKSKAELIEAKGHQLKLALDDVDALLPILADEKFIHEMLSRLMDNAIQFCPMDGTGQIEVQMAEVDEHIIIEITNNGTVIAPEDLPHIFKRFYRIGTRRTGGIGLGLSIVQKIAHDHHGTIEIKSTPETGTTARVRLPLNRQPETLAKI